MKCSKPGRGKAPRDDPGRIPGESLGPVRPRNQGNPLVEGFKVPDLVYEISTTTSSGTTSSTLLGWWWPLAGGIAFEHAGDDFLKGFQDAVTT
jgi:hypothetical protein